jgi:hypothetical protein
MRLACERRVEPAVGGRLHLRVAPLYVLAVQQPAIVGYRALPTDCLVVLDDEAAVIARGDDVLRFRPGSLLATRSASGSRASRPSAHPHILPST